MNVNISFFGALAETTDAIVVLRRRVSGGPVRRPRGHNFAVGPPLTPHLPLSYLICNTHPCRNMHCVRITQTKIIELKGPNYETIYYKRLHNNAGPAIVYIGLK